MKRVMPATCSNAGCRRRITSLAEPSRWLSGFRLISTRPLLSVVLVPSMPMNDDRLSTAGSFRITPVSDRCSRDISANDTVCAASETPWITPVSWIGKKPFGI